MEPIAKRLRQSAADGWASHSKTSGDDVDEQIRKLEASLESDESSENEESDESADESSDKIVLLSELDSERVSALPQHCLPKKSCSTSHSSVVKKQVGPKKWAEKLPFSCKVCRFVGADMAELVSHRASKEHIDKEGLTKKQLLCALCNKSFTSEDQVAEHKKGKWHQLRQQRRQERHVVKLCYDFLRGHCSRGDQCMFDHTKSKPDAHEASKALKKRKRRPCKEFSASGSCRFGNNCIFSHDLYSEKATEL